MRKGQLVFISTPAIGNLVPMVELTVRLTRRDPRLSAAILVITIPQRPIVSNFVQSRAAAPSLRFVHLPAADPPSPDEFQSSIGYISVYVQKHKPLVKQALADLMSESARVLALFVDMFCTPVADAAEELGIPSYLFFASPASFLGFVDHMKELEGEMAPEQGGMDSDLSIPTFTNKVPKGVFPSAALRGRDGSAWLIRHARRHVIILMLFCRSINGL